MLLMGRYLLYAGRNLSHTVAGMAEGLPLPFNGSLPAHLPSTNHYAQNISVWLIAARPAAFAGTVRRDQRCGRCWGSDV